MGNTQHCIVLAFVLDHNMYSLMRVALSPFPLQRVAKEK